MGFVSGYCKGMILLMHGQVFYFLKRKETIQELAYDLIAVTCLNNAEVLLGANGKHNKHIPDIQSAKFKPLTK